MSQAYLKSFRDHKWDLFQFIFRVLDPTGASGGLQNHILALFWNFEWFSSIFFKWIIQLNILDSIEWIFRILFWIEFWIESYLGPIQWKNEFSKRIGQGY